MPKLTLQELKSHLWESANILRGSIDSGDFKNYILGMLFFKRLSDVYDEEYDELKQTVGEELVKNPDMYTRFFRPDECSWMDILNTSVNIGEKINDVFAKVTRANSPKLDGILDRIEFNDKDSLPDENHLNRFLFPCPHQPSINKVFYKDRLNLYLEYVKQNLN
jgi:type I restriction enzyme M protein